MFCNNNKQFKVFFDLKLHNTHIKNAEFLKFFLKTEFNVCK